MESAENKINLAISKLKNLEGAESARKYIQDYCENKNVGEIIKSIANLEYKDAELFLDFILSTESGVKENFEGVKENFENELCKTSFEQIKNSNLLNYFWENMNLPKCQNVLKKLALNKNGEYKYDAGNLIDSFYNYLIHEKKIGRQETDDYFINLINEENNIIKFIHDMDFFINNIDNDIVRKLFSDVGINTEDIEETISRIGIDVKYFDVNHWNPDPGIRAQMRSGKEEFIKKRGLFIYELMMRPDISEKLPVAKYKQNGALEPNQEIIDPEIWYIFTETLKSKIKNNDLNEAECKNISNEKWFSYVFAKMLDSVEKLRTEMEATKYDWGKDEEHKELSRLTSVLCDFVSAVYKVKRNKDELYDIIWDNMYYIPSEFFLQQIPNGNFSLRNIIFHKAKLSQKDKDDIWEKTKSAYKVETDEQGNEKLVFNQNLSEEELNIIKKKTGYEYVVTMKNGKQEIVFNTNENGKLVKKEWKSGSKFFWDGTDIKNFLELNEVWKRKMECYKEFRFIGMEYIFSFDLNDIGKIINDNSQVNIYRRCQKFLLRNLDNKFEYTHSSFSKYFQKNTNNLTMADWLIYRLQFLDDDAKDKFCCNLVNLIYKDFDEYQLVEEEQKYPNTKYELINKFMNQISEECLRKNLFSKKNNILKSIISAAREKNDTLFSKLSMSCLNKLKYDTQNNNERQNFLNLFSLCSGEIINHVDVNFILDNLDNNCVWENLKYLTEKCPHKNEDGSENENRKKIRLICENKNFNGLNKLKNRHRSNSVKISSEDNKKGELKEKLWKEDEPKNVINKDKNFGRICKTQEEYWLKLIEFGPKDIIGYLDWRFIYLNLDKKLIRNHLKYINWSIVLSEDNSLDKIMKFIAEKEKFYTQDMEQDLNNIFWQKFKHVKDNPISNYNFLFLLNIHPQTMANMDISFLAENLLNENIFDMEFLKTNLFHIGGEDRIKNLCEYIETNELDPQKKKNKFRLLLNSSIFAECLVYINYDDDLASIAINKLENNVVNQLLRSCSQQKVNSIYESIAKSDFNQDKKIKMLKLILCRISDEALNYLIEQNIIAQSIVTVFYGQPGDYILSEGRKCIKKDEDMTNLIKQSLKKFKVQKKKLSEKQNQQHPQKNVINDNKNDDNSNIIEDNLKIDQQQTEIDTKINQGQNDPNKGKRNDVPNTKILITDDKSNNSNNNIQINASRNDNNGNIITQISMEAQQIQLQIPITDNNANNKSNMPPNNKKTRIGLGVVGLIFIIAGICLFFTAPKIAIILLVVGGLLFISAIGFNKFRSCLCCNKNQIGTSQQRNKKSIDDRTNNLQAEQMPDTNEINNKDSLIQN